MNKEKTYINNKLFNSIVNDITQLIINQSYTLNNNNKPSNEKKVKDILFNLGVHKLDYEDLKS